MVPQAAYRSCSGVCVTDRKDVQPIGRRLSMRPQILTYDQKTIRIPGLPSNGLRPVIHVIRRINCFSFSRLPSINLSTQCRLHEKLSLIYRLYHKRCST